MLALRSPLLTREGFAHGFSLRTGGVSRPPFHALNLGRHVGDDPACVARNHELFARHVGYRPDALYEVSQVHGGRVERVERDVPADVFRLREADALLCATPDLAIGVRVADCVPVLLADPGTRYVAAVHAGWRGIVSGVIAAAVRALCAASGAPKDRILAAFGPHIGVSAFEVGPEVAQELALAVPGASVVVAAEPRPHVSLAAAVRAQLLSAGLAFDRIDQIEGCTYEEPARFFSFRRDGVRSGRHLAAIVAGC